MRAPERRSVTRRYGLTKNDFSLITGFQSRSESMFTRNNRFLNSMPEFRPFDAIDNETREIFFTQFIIQNTIRENTYLLSE